MKGISRNAEQELHWLIRAGEDVVENLCHVSNFIVRSNKADTWEMSSVATGYHLRERLSPHRRAIALAKSYPFNFLKDPAEMQKVHREISESMCAFPDQWETSERGGFPAVFENLENRIGWKFDPSLFAKLMNQDGMRESGPLERFLASMI